MASKSAQAIAAAEAAQTAQQQMADLIEQVRTLVTVVAAQTQLIEERLPSVPSVDVKVKK